MILNVCICEGSAEMAILDLLLGWDLLVFNKNSLLNREVLDGRYRNPKKLEDDFLNRFYKDMLELNLYICIDSKKVASNGYKLSKEYQKIKTNLRYAISSPEIEIIYIISVDKYDEYTNKYKNRKFKPSQYVKNILKKADIKSYDFIKEHFSNKEYLLDTLKKYDKYCKHENTIYKWIK